MSIIMVTDEQAVHSNLVDFVNVQVLVFDIVDLFVVHRHSVDDDL